MIKIVKYIYLYTYIYMYILGIYIYTVYIVGQNQNRQSKYRKGGLVKIVGRHWQDPEQLKMPSLCAEKRTIGETGCICFFWKNHVNSLCYQGPKKNLSMYEKSPPPRGGWGWASDPTSSTWSPGMARSLTSQGSYTPSSGILKRCSATHLKGQ